MARVGRRSSFAHPELAQALRSVHSTLRLLAAALKQGEASAIIGCFVDD
jgi:hypothetical protein